MATNLMSKAHKATNKAYRNGYDRIFKKECTVWLEDVTKPGNSVRKYKQLGGVCPKCKVFFHREDCPICGSKVKR